MKVQLIQKVFQHGRWMRRPWLRSLALIPGALLPLLPSATCPACIPAYTGVLAAVELGFLFNELVLTPLITAFLVVGIASIAWSTRSHRRAGPLITAILGSAAVVAGRLNSGACPQFSTAESRSCSERHSGTCG